MRVFVLGGSGGVGHHVLALAKERGHDVTALVRPGSRAKLERTHTSLDGVRIVEGDVLTHALDVVAGHDAIVSSVGLMRTNPANPWSKLVTPPDLNSRAARRIVDAMKAHGVPRVIQVSAAGVGDSAPRMNALMKFFVATSKVGVAYRDLAEAERVLRESGLDWLAPRPTRLTDGPRTGAVKEVDAFAMSAAIARADVAAWMLDALAVADWGARWPARTPTITTT